MILSVCFDVKKIGEIYVARVCSLLYENTGVRKFAPQRKIAPPSGSGSGLGLALELGLGAIFLEPKTLHSKKKIIHIFALKTLQLTVTFLLKHYSIKKLEFSSYVY